MYTRLLQETQYKFLDEDFVLDIYKDSSGRCGQSILMHLAK